MTREIALPPEEKTNATSRPVVRSYDTGFEHSVEHLLSVRRMVEEADAGPVEARGETTLRGVAAA